MQRYNPVSYTHLKTNSHRKQHIFLEHIGKLEKDQKRRVAQNADSQPEFALLDSLGAVSYTHLDVYKRQSQKVAAVFKRTAADRTAGG